MNMKEDQNAEIALNLNTIVQNAEAKLLENIFLVVENYFTLIV